MFLDLLSPQTSVQSLLIIASVLPLLALKSQSNNIFTRLSTNKVHKNSNNPLTFNHFTTYSVNEWEKVVIEWGFVVS